MLKLSPELDISWLHLRLEKAGDVAKIRKLSRIIFPVSDSALFVLFCFYVFFFQVQRAGLWSTSKRFVSADAPKDTRRRLESDSHSAPPPPSPPSSLNHPSLDVIRGGDWPPLSITRPGLEVRSVFVRLFGRVISSLISDSSFSFHHSVIIVLAPP